MIFTFSIASVLFATTAQSAPYTTSCLSTESRPTASIDAGVLVGTARAIPSATTKVNQFLGIPFGTRPQRFGLPKPAEPWDAPFDASKYEPPCVQKFNYPEESRNITIKVYNDPPSPVEDSEDCLNLNVFAPATTHGSKAVMFWLFGGGYGFGANSLPLYDGTSFAANHDVVVVTTNYRTNVFGFPGSPQIPKEEQNVGLFDQRLALDWVQRNIASFGGDPKKVTLFGESAGAGSAEILVTNPPEPPSFRAAILQSGVSVTTAPSKNASASWDALVKAANCTSTDSLACIRALPATQLRDVIERSALDFAPYPDGGTTWKPTGRLDRLNSTEEEPIIARVPILIGSTADEGTTYMYADSATRELVGNLNEETAPTEKLKMLAKAYPLGAPGMETEFKRSSLILTEYAGLCPAALVANESSLVDVPTWRYLYNASFPNTEVFNGSGAYHSAEISPIFGTYPREGATPFQIELSKVMQKAWADFAKNPEAGPGWQEYPSIAVLGGGATVGESDEGRETITLIEPEVLDQRCPLFRPLYDLAAGLIKVQ